MTVCRGIRGATIAEANTAEAIYKATGTLLADLVEANNIVERDVAAVYFTTTPDLNASFPAAAARQMGWNNTALMGGTEVDVPGRLNRCSRVSMLKFLNIGQSSLWWKQYNYRYCMPHPQHPFKYKNEVFSSSKCFYITLQF